MSKSLLLFQRVIFTLFILAACLCYTSAVSARTCFLPDSEDCGNGEGEVPDADVTCASYGGYDTEAACKTDYADVAVVCSLNNGCYYPYCQYRNERSCLKDMTSSEKCLSKKVEALDETCWYKEGKTCRELNSDYIGGNMPCRADFSGQKVVKKEVPGVTGLDGQCYTCDVFKTCKQLNADYYNVNEPCPENTERKDSGKVGSDGKCYTCENKRCSDSGWKVSGSCGINEKETEVGSGIEGTCVECTLKTCREINGSWMPKAECSGIASVTGTTGADGECYTCTIESCPTGYSADVTSCGADYKLDKNGTANGKDCGKCIRKETCADYSLINEAACDTSKNTFTFSRSDDYGNKCGTCVKKNSCEDYGLESELYCDKSYNTFTPIKTDDYGNKCGICVEDIVFTFYVEPTYAQFAGKYGSCDGPLTSSTIIDYGISNYDRHPCLQTSYSEALDISRCHGGHKAWWRGAFSHDGGPLTDDEEKRFVLPAELKIVVTYDIPRYKVLSIGASCSVINTTLRYSGPEWLSPEVASRSMPLYKARTVTFTLPKGTSIDLFRNNEVVHHLPAIDYSEDVENNPKYRKVEYYFDGEKLPEGVYYKKIGRYTYRFLLYDAFPWPDIYDDWSENWPEEEKNNWEGR